MLKGLRIDRNYYQGEIINQILDLRDSESDRVCSILEALISMKAEREASICSTLLSALRNRKIDDLCDLDDSQMSFAYGVINAATDCVKMKV